MRRREFITLIGGAAAWPLAARAQQPAMPVIGILNGGAAAPLAKALAAFRNGLAEAGFVEGRNVAIEFRWADGEYSRLPALAAELVERRVALIYAGGTQAAPFAAIAATSTIPIVFSSGSDPLKSGLVTSLRQPGGNVTGAFLLTTDLEEKRLQMLLEVVPAASTIGVLINPTYPEVDRTLKDLQVRAKEMAKQIMVVRASNEADIHEAFATLVKERADALLVASDPFLFAQRKHIIALAARNRLPAIYQWRDFVEDGGLMSYGTTLTETYRTVGGYAGRILKGEKPGDLPVVQSTKVELLINLKTAKALGLAMPTPLLGRADEVIE